MTTRASALFAGVAGLVIVIAVAGGLAVIGSPGSIRLQRLDDARSQNLLSIANAIRGYRLSHQALPERLEQLQQDSFINIRLQDVETGAPVEYRVINALSYELCAQFATVSDGKTRPGGSRRFWQHPEGRHCFTIESNGPDGAEVTNRIFR